jgi:hypothetical protein
MQRPLLRARGDLAPVIAELHTNGYGQQVVRGVRP